MAQTRERVRRLLTSELGECCEADLEERLSNLHRLGTRAVEDAAVERDSAVLKPLGNETRLGLLRYLDAADRELCVCELETLADVSESAVSHALADLTDAGLVTREKHGKWRYYEPTDRASALLATLDRHRVHDRQTGDQEGDR